MDPGRILRLGDRRLRPALLAITVIVAALAFAAPAGARFPVPRCGWVKPSLVQQTFGVPVTGGRPHWVTKLSPILRCNYSEQQPSLQVAGTPIVRIEYREVQRFQLLAGMVPVGGLGSCKVRVSCPTHSSRTAAWIFTQDAVTSLTPQFTSGILLAVEDGLNMFSIQVSNPFGPLPVAGEEAGAIHLAKRLIPRFRYK